MSSIRSLNPATGKIECEFSALTGPEIESRLEQAQHAHTQYRKTKYEIRSQWLNQTARILEDRRQIYGSLIAKEMGKPIQSAIEEILKCAWNCHFFAENGPKFLEEEQIEVAPASGLVKYPPLGIILAIMPWNFPFWQVFRFAAPTLMAGNGIILKHASNVPQCALEIEKIFLEAGFPKHVFQTLLVTSSQVKSLIEDNRIAAVTLTGSVEAGSLVASACGKEIKKTVLELGGSDPFIVMPSADINRAVQNALDARMVNSGQSCIAAKRFIIADEIADEFERKLCKLMKELKVGNPMDFSTQIGPLATEEILQSLDDQVHQTLKKGAKLIMGGMKLNQPGYFYAPTLLTEISKNSAAYQEELFGPVALIFKVKNIYEAVELANDTRFGLAASAWTQDENEKSYFIDEIQAGSVFINHKVASDPRLPFGGIKHSGYGRELGAWGIREFVNIKTILIM